MLLFVYDMFIIWFDYNLFTIYNKRLFFHEHKKMTAMVVMEMKNLHVGIAVLTNHLLEIS